MGKLVSSVIEIGSFGLIQDPLGIEAGEEAAERAAGVQESAALAGIEETRRQFDLTREDLRPRIEAEQTRFETEQARFDVGSEALQEQQALIGLRGDREQLTALRNLRESPGQLFLRLRQQRALVRNASAIGGLGGGNVRTALQEQATGFAQQDLQNQFGRLASIVRPAGNTAGNTAAQLGQFGAQSAANIANLGIAGSEARASGILGKQQAGTQATNQLLQVAGIAAGAASRPAPQFILPQAA